MFRDIIFPFKRWETIKDILLYAGLIALIGYFLIVLLTMTYVASAVEASL